MRTFRILSIGLASLFLFPAVARSQGGKWVAARCDLKPGHFLVNSGQLYLKSATETRFEEQKQKDLRDANRVLTEALTKGQDKNPATWYYLGRLYLMTNDFAGADSAFTHAETLKPDCKNDIEGWRQTIWIPTLNAGIAAWQANNNDSAIKAFRAAAAINQNDPRGYKYLASLLYQAGQQDSAVYYFRRTAEVAAKDPKFAQDRRDALYNMGRIQQAMARAAQDSASKAKPDSISPRWNQALATYREYLALYPNDAEILASQGSVMMMMGQRDSALAAYKQIIARADSVGAIPIFRAGVEIYQSAPPEPDTAAVGSSCRTQARASRLTPARVRARCDSATTAAWRAYSESAKDAYKLSVQAFEAGVKLNPYYRDGVFNLVNTYLILNDTAKMLPMAQKLVAIDPMNRQSLRLLAFAHQQKGRTDSTIHYLRQADSTLVADVSITQFESDTAGVQMRGMVQNLKSSPTPPLKLVFDLLNAKGDVVTSQTVEIPAVQPQQVHVFEIKATGAGIAAWRYKRG